MPKVITAALPIFLILVVGTTVLSPAQQVSGKSEVSFKEIRNLVKEGAVAYKDGDLERADRLLDSALQLDDSNADAYFYKAQIALANDDKISATEILETAVNQAPRSQRIKLLLASLKLQQQEYEEAASLLDSILSLQPHNGRAQYLKGRIYLEQGDTLKALDALEKAAVAAMAELK